MSFIFTEPPSAPGKPESLEVAHDSLTLYWKAPEDDGNDEIIEYIIEYQEKTEIRWTHIKQITDTSYKVDKLKSNSEYTFRVTAVNNVGPSPPSPSATFKISAPFEKEAPVILEELTDQFVGLKQKLTLSCAVGGTPVPDVVWYKNKTVITTEEITYENRVTKYIIEETDETTESEYTCIATNEVGKAETKCNITVQEKPTVFVEEKLINQKLRKSAEYKVTAKITGYPQPEIRWLKDNIEIKSSKKVTITNSTTTSEIHISKLERSHSGKYTIEVSNRAGTSTVDLTIQVIGNYNYIGNTI